MQGEILAKNGKIGTITRDMECNHDHHHCTECNAITCGKCRGAWLRKGVEEVGANPLPVVLVIVAVALGALQWYGYIDVVSGAKGLWEFVQNRAS